MNISILMLTYNAPSYVFKSIRDVHKTKKVTDNLELIVLDNSSKFPTKFILKILKKLGFIDKLVLNPQNDFFARGNNLASQHASNNATHYLLLNSDIKITDINCFNKLSELHPKDGGISSFGAVLSEPKRADGYCMLIDKDLYDKFKLDEDFQWWWSVTKLQSQVLSSGYKIIAVRNHEEYIHHYGGKSGKGFEDVKGMNTDIEIVKGWFEKGHENLKIIKQL
ncbi:glycosyltransferase family 2 protein [Methanobrevibacter sp.]